MQFDVEAPITFKRTVHNPFKDPTLKSAFDELVREFTVKHRNLFNTDGQPKKGNSHAEYFWRGFEGEPIGMGFVDNASKKTLAYAYWRAGQLCAKEMA